MCVCVIILIITHTRTLAWENAIENCNNKRVAREVFHTLTQTQTYIDYVHTSYSISFIIIHTFLCPPNYPSPPTQKPLSLYDTKIELMKLTTFSTGITTENYIE